MYRTTTTACSFRFFLSTLLLDLMDLLIGLASPDHRFELVESFHFRQGLDCLHLRDAWVGVAGTFGLENRLTSQSCFHSSHRLNSPPRPQRRTSPVGHRRYPTAANGSHHRRHPSQPTGETERIVDFNMPLRNKLLGVRDPDELFFVFRCFSQLHDGPMALIARVNRSVVTVGTPRWCDLIQMTHHQHEPIFFGSDAFSTY